MTALLETASDYVEEWACPVTSALFGRSYSSDVFLEEDSLGSPIKSNRHHQQQQFLSFNPSIEQRQQHSFSTLCSPMNRLMVDTTAVQRFLASLSDLSTANQEIYQLENVPVRCHLIREVQELYEKFQTAQSVNPQAYRLNVIVAALKEILRSIPNGLFGNMSDEFCKISLESSLQITIMYLSSIISELSPSVRLFSYWLCKALKNLTRLTNGRYVDVYTDMLLHFTPVLFPNTLGDVHNFLRGARLLLVMIDYNEKVFYQIPPTYVDDNDICTSQLSSNNENADEELFFRNIINSLQNLEATLACEDSGVESEPEDISSPLSPNSPLSKWSSGYGGSSLSLDLNVNNSTLSTNFYHFAYIEPDDQLTPTIEDL